MGLYGLIAKSPLAICQATGNSPDSILTVFGPAILFRSRLYVPDRSTRNHSKTPGYRLWLQAFTFVQSAQYVTFNFSFSTCTHTGDEVGQNNEGLKDVAWNGKRICGKWPFIPLVVFLSVQRAGVLSIRAYDFQTRMFSPPSYRTRSCHCTRNVRVIQPQILTFKILDLHVDV